MIMIDDFKDLRYKLGLNYIKYKMLQQLMQINCLIPE